jgi:glycogen debranching enzyme
VIPFDVTQDLKRQVMVPPGFFLLVKSPVGFRAEILDARDTDRRSLGYEEGLPLKTGGFFALFMPKTFRKFHQPCRLNLRLFHPDKIQKASASLLYLAPFDTLNLKTSFTRRKIAADPGLTLLAATRTGGMMRAAGDWGQLHSRYDSLLGANLNPDMPENRWMTLARCRIWAIFQGYSRELAKDCLQSFMFSYDNAGRWRFHVPSSEGKYYVLELTLMLSPHTNQVRLSISRPGMKNNRSRILSDDAPVTLIIRPDMEDRSFHDTIKAFTGPETDWPARVRSRDTGFDFSLSNGHTLSMDIQPPGRFVPEPEWQYMVHRPLEATRGLDPASDLFSPGYFSCECIGGHTAELMTRVGNGRTLDPDAWPAPVFESGLTMEQALVRALDAFLVDRGQGKSVIAGYPWFLDWGRDSLIFCRSLVELGRLSEARAILHLFGRFERNGTLPNMICGQDAANIETSDAPLWFFACCRDILEKTQDTGFLDQDLEGRTLRQVLLDMASSLETGTPTGVKMDPKTRLLYSPSHFTWMDTNFPAGSPRQGYPVEIQALWHNALMFLEKIDPGSKWEQKADQVKQSVETWFWNEAAGYFSDCLHSDCLHGDGPAARAVPDDALRPNQLLLITLGVISPGKKARKTVETCLELLVPGGIRSLADRKLAVPLPVVHNGNLVNDPDYPYAGVYQGDEDTNRKPAYHNGTAWTWPFPVFCEAWAKVFGQNSHASGLAWLGSMKHLMRTGAAGYIPEILDGDFPHTPRGCDAQAWGVSEAARVVHKLSVRRT